VVVTMDLGALEQRAGRPGRLDDGAVTGEAARRLACDASVTRVITGPRSQVLDVGWRTQVVPSAIRRALVVRDGGCRFPGSETQHTWCDAHHIQHWFDGGSTTTSNLLLLCRRHHRAIHDGFGVRVEDGEVWFARADGTPLEPHPP
jgi:hypothetical protein